MVRLPSNLSGHLVWPSHQFWLSFRGIEELLAEQGIHVTEVGETDGFS